MQMYPLYRIIIGWASPPYQTEAGGLSHHTAMCWAGSLLPGVAPGGCRMWWQVSNQWQGGPGDRPDRRRPGVQLPATSTEGRGRAAMTSRVNEGRARGELVTGRGRGPGLPWPTIGPR